MNNIPQKIFELHGAGSGTFDVTIDAGPEFNSWPSLDDLSLSTQHLDWRIEGVGGSDANTILSGDGDRITRLWREKRREAEPEDLTGTIPVMLGLWTEAFNRQWYERASGHCVTRAGERSTAADLAWRRCTIDGFVAAEGAVFEAKHVGAFVKADEVVARYMPQLQHNMAVLGAERAVLSVLFANHKWECFEIAADWLYQEELLIAEARFWDCVRFGEPPVPHPIPQAPKPVAYREACFEGSNTWSSHAADWLDLRDAAKRHADAVTAIKSLVEPDVSRAFGHGIEVKRNKAGALTIKALTQ